MTSRYADIIAAGLCVVAAVSLQIQTTLFAQPVHPGSPTLMGIRVNLTDLVVPFAGVAILWTLMTKQSAWPQWNMRYVYVWLAALTALLGAALVHTHFTYDEISRWALVNKFGGWFVLLAIMGMGAWIAANATEKSLTRFIKFFLYFFLASTVVQLLSILIMLVPAIREAVPPGTYFYYPAEGWMANRNAYGLLFLTALSVSICFYFHRPQTVPPIIAHAICFLAPLFLMLNGSRAAMLACALIAPALLFLHRAEKRLCRNLILCVLAGTALQGVISYNFKAQLIPIHDLDRYEFLQGPQNLSKEEMAYPGDSMRIMIIKDAMDMVRENPVLGSGLGSMMLYQEKIHGHAINVIDCTALWILVEMGAVGLLIFAAFYFKIAQSLYRSWKTDEEFSRTLRLSLMFVLFAFTFMSLFHEILYTRFIWFFLGIGLALPSRMRQDV